jgi:fumarate reductase flavoprotein subunit
MEPMRIESADVVIVGGGAAGLRAALEIVGAMDGGAPGTRTIPAAAGRPSVALVSKVYPMRSHTVAAEGGAAGVATLDDDLDSHAADTLAGGAGLGEEEAVRFVVDRAPGELARLERWGMPWSRDADGRPAVRPFGGMSRPRTWFAADKTGFHLLHTLFQTSLRQEAIRRYDEYLVLDLVVTGEGADRRVAGVVAYDQHAGEPVFLAASAVILATGGAARLYATSTNAGICTGDGMAMALRAGVGLRDIEFLQFHPTCLPGSGILITEAARGEGGVLLDAEGRRYLADYGLGPETPVGEPVARTMELASRDKVSQAFWFADRDGRTIPTPDGGVVHLDLRHLGAERIAERLPLVAGLAKQFAGVDPARELVPVRPAAHYTMGGIRTDVRGVVGELPGLFAAGECASTGLHGANRLGSNSLVETLVIGASAGAAAAEFALDQARPTSPIAAGVIDQARALAQPWLDMRGRGSEPPALIRRELGRIMDDDAGIVRDAEGLARAAVGLDALAQRYADVRVTDTSEVMNTDWSAAIELGAMLDVARSIVAAAAQRTETRGAHDRMDFPATGEAMHSMVRWRDGGPVVSREPVGASPGRPSAAVSGESSSSSSGIRHDELHSPARKDA